MSQEEIRIVTDQMEKLIGKMNTLLGKLKESAPAGRDEGDAVSGGTADPFERLKREAIMRRRKHQIKNS